MGRSCSSPYGFHPRGRKKFVWGDCLCTNTLSQRTPCARGYSGEDGVSGARKLSVISGTPRVHVNWCTSVYWPTRICRHASGDSMFHSTKFFMPMQDRSFNVRCTSWIMSTILYRNEIFLYSSMVRETLFLVESYPQLLKSLLSHGIRAAIESEER